MIDYEKLKEIRNMGYIKHTGIRTVDQIMIPRFRVAGILE